MQRIKIKIGELLVPGNKGTWDEVRARLNRVLRGWSTCSPMAPSRRHTRLSISMSMTGRGTSFVNDTKCRGVERSSSPGNMSTGNWPSSIIRKSHSTPTVRNATSACTSPGAKSAVALGRDRRDAFPGLMRTATRLGFSFLDCLGDRLRVPDQPAIPCLPDLITGHPCRPLELKRLGFCPGYEDAVS